MRAAEVGRLGRAGAVFLALLGVVLAAGSSAQAAPTLAEVASELRAVSGKFELLAPETLAHLRAVPRSELPTSLPEEALAAARAEQEPGEILEGLNESAVAIVDDAGVVQGWIVLPLAYLAVPEGDTDYYVVYYVFFSAQPAFVELFKSFRPLYLKGAGAPAGGADTAALR